MMTRFRLRAGLQPQCSMLNAGCGHRDMSPNSVLLKSIELGTVIVQKAESSSSF